MNTPKSIYSKTVEIALDALASKDRRIAELESQIAGHPEALAAAKREALESAADRARENGKVYSTPLMTEDELRRMAREVEP